MKFPGLLLVVGLLACPGCERARTLMGTLEKSTVPAPLPARDLVRNLSPDEMGAFCRQPGRLTIVEYYADWNGQSMQLISIFKGITDEFGGRVLLGRIDVDSSAAFTAAQGVKSTPDVRFYNDGVLVDRFVGLPDDREIRDRIAKQVKILPTTAPEPKAAPAAGTKPLAEPMRKDWLPPGLRKR